MCDQTPLATFDLPRSEQAPGMARAFLADYLCRSHGLDVADEAALLTTEAVTNAVKYAGPPIVMSLLCDGDQVEIRVSDSNPDPPVRQRAGDLEDHGRGVALIDLVSDRWGTDQHPGDGKDVWFTLPSR